MLRGWFDAFRDEGGPTLYYNPNRTAVLVDLRNILIYISFSTLFLAFLIVFPGVRKERISTFVSVTISLFIGASILVCMFGNEWHVSSAVVSSPYRAFSKERITARVGVHIGLNSVNITLKAMPLSSHSDEIDFNERFHWFGVSEMKEDYHAALVKGLPFPILTIAEYLSHDLEGFSWGRKYRQAGYYAYFLLWTSFALWLLMNLLLCVIPRYGAYTMQLTGFCMILTCAIYCILLPTQPLRIPFDSRVLTFTFGWCFQLLLLAGGIAVVTGMAVTIVDVLFPNKFSTILQVDFDTPYQYWAGHDHMGDRRRAVQHLQQKLKEFQPEKSNIIPVGSPTMSGLSTVSSMLSSRDHDRDLEEVARDLEKEVQQTSRDDDHASTSRDRRDGVDNHAFDTSEEEDDGSVMIDGKRAVSLQNFEKYLHHRQRHHHPNRRKSTNNVLHTIISTSTSAASVEGVSTRPSISIDLQSAAMW